MVAHGCIAGNTYSIFARVSEFRDFVEQSMTLPSPTSYPTGKCKATGPTVDLEEVGGESIGDRFWQTVLLKGAHYSTSSALNIYCHALI